MSGEELLFSVDKYKLYVYNKGSIIHVYQVDSYNQLIKSLFFEEWNIV